MLSRGEAEKKLLQVRAGARVEGAAGYMEVDVEQEVQERSWAVG